MKSSFNYPPTKADVKKNPLGKEPEPNADEVAILDSTVEKEKKEQATIKKLEELRAQFIADETLARERQLISEDPALQEFYTAVIENFDMARLREKSLAQLTALEKKYFSGLKVWNWREKAERRKNWNYSEK